MINDFLVDPTGFPYDNVASQPFPEFFDLFLKDKQGMNAPEPVNGDIVLHIAYKHGRFNELLSMIEHNGNLFF